MAEGIDDFYRYWLRRILGNITRANLAQCRAKLKFIHDGTPWQQEYPWLYEVCVNNINARIEQIFFKTS